VALENWRHFSAKFDVGGEDLVDVRRVHEDLEDLIEQIVDGLVADFDSHLLGGELLHPRDVGAGKTARLNGVARLVRSLFLGADVLVEYGFDVGLNFARSLGFDVFRVQQNTHHIGGDGTDSTGIKTHGRRVR
jgi:hypothetical protein